MDDKVQLCLTDGSEDVSDVVADVTLRSDRLDPDLSNSTQWIPINDCLLTQLSWVFTPEIIAKVCRSRNDLLATKDKQLNGFITRLFHKEGMILKA